MNMSDAEHPLAPADDHRAEEIDRTDNDSDDRVCQISDCSRPGAVPRTFRSYEPDEPTTPHYVCRYHYRVFVGLRVLVLATVVAAFLFVYFRV